MIGEILKSLIGKALDFKSDKALAENSKTIKQGDRSQPAIEPLKWLKIGHEAGQLIRKQGRFPEEKIIFDTPTGLAPILPIAYWLMGAKQVITTDCAHDFDVDCLIQNLKGLCQFKNEVESIFGECLKKPRFYELIEFMDHPFHMQKFLEMTQIDYWAPADAADIALPNNSIDFYISAASQEKDPRRKDRLSAEAHRLLKPQGLMIDWQQMTVWTKPL